MDTALLVILAIIILFFSYIMIKSFFLQRQFKNSLDLNKTKNTNVLLKQASGLVVSLALFVVVLNNSSYLVPLKNDASPISARYGSILEDIESYYKNTESKDILDTFSQDVMILGEVILEDNTTYTLVLIDELYFLFDKKNETLVEFKPLP